jgi:hypothetical protein
MIGAAKSIIKYSQNGFEKKHYESIREPGIQGIKKMAKTNAA